MSGGIAAFALWTLLYELGLGLHWPVTLLTLGWLVLAVPLGFLVGRASYRAERRPEAATTRSGADSRPGGDPTPAAAQRQSGRRAGLRAAIRRWPAGLAAVAAAVLLTAGSGLLFWLGWLLAAAALVWIAVDLRRTVDSPAGGDRQRPGGPAGDPAPRRSSRWPPVAMLVTGLAVGAGSLFVYRVSADDAYYVNLSTWVVAHDHFALRDTMFSNQVFPTSYGGGFPITSIEGLIGALARLTGLSAPTAAYLVFAPTFAFAAVWALGQLARSWAPRLALPVFAVSVFFVLVGRGNAYRAYSVNSIWIGKAAAIAIVLPLIWIYATRLAESRRGHWIRMLGLAGVAFIGLTSTAAILAPAIGCALLLAAVLLRNARIALGALALVVAPLLGGAAVAVLSRSVGGPHPQAQASWGALHHAYGSTSTALVLLTVSAVFLAPVLLRGRQAGALAWSAAAATVLVLAPGALWLGNRLTSAGPVEWRLLLIAPVPTLVGVLVAAAAQRCGSLAGDRRAVRTAIAAVTAAAALAALSVADGAPPWPDGLRLSRTPVWKVKQRPLHNVRALIATDPPRGRPILMPPAAMIVLSIYTVEWHGVAPRPLYVASLQEPARLKAARKVLVRLAAARHPAPSPSAVRQALHRLDVGTVCLPPADHSGQRSVRSAGFGPFARVGTLSCAYRTRAGG